MNMRWLKSLLTRVSDIWYELNDPVYKPKKITKLKFGLSFLLGFGVYRFPEYTVPLLAVGGALYLGFRIYLKFRDLRYRKKLIEPSNKKVPSLETRVTEKWFK